MKPGSYEAVGTEQRWTTSQACTPGLALTVDVLDSFGGVESMVGTIWFSTRSEKGMEMALQQLVYLGFNPRKQKLADIGNTVSFVDRKCEVQIEDNEWPK